MCKIQIHACWPCSYANLCRYDTTLSDACVTLAKKWSSASDSDLSSFSVDDLKPLSSYQVKEFLAQLLEEVCFKRFGIELI